MHFQQSWPSVILLMKSGRSCLVLTFHLVKVDMRAFSSTFCSQKYRLKETYSDEYINEIDEDFVKLKRAYSEESAFKNVADTCNDNESQQNFQLV